MNMPWYIILFLALSLVMGAVILAFIYFGLIRPGRSEEQDPR